MIQVAFAGHARPRDLGSHEPVSRALAKAFALIREAGVDKARLLTGLASGADQLAAEAWRAEGLGPIHAVMPHLQDADSAADMADGVTWLDGEAFEAEGRNAHLKQSRFIVEASDLLVVVWTGGLARGVGGTADSVQCALEAGLPVLWIKPSDDEPLRLIRAEAMPLDFHFPEFQTAVDAGHLEHVEYATAENLRRALALASTQPKPPVREGPWRTRIDRWLHSWLWRAHANFRKLVGGRMHVAEGPPPPGDLAVQPGFRALTEAYRAADEVANRLSAVHRSEQLLLVTAMILAAVVGSAWAIWPDVKLIAVWIELAISVGALLVWAAGSDARQHERWSESRYLAEQLRLERAGWALGVSLASALPAATRAGDGSWRAARQAAGLPLGRFDADRTRAWGEWSLHELIHGQRAYHRATSERDARIAHRIHLVEDVSFMVLFVAFAFYVSYTGANHDYPKWFGGVIAMIGTVVPALAAASMALEAKLEFQEQSTRSGRMAASLDALAGRLKPITSLDKLQNAARAAIRLHIAEASHWREGSGRRRLLRA